MTNIKKILLLVAATTGIANAGGYVAIIGDGNNFNSSTPTPPEPDPVEFDSDLTVGLIKPWSSGYHRGYNYSTPLGAMTPEFQNGYRIRALTSYKEPGYSNAVLEIDGNYTSGSDRYIPEFKVEFIGFKTYIYKNQEKYIDPAEEGFVNFSEFRPDNDASVGVELDGWFSSKNGQTIKVKITEIENN